MATFVLIPGGWRGGWACEPVSARLRRLGHTVHALTLPGLGDDGAEAGRITLAPHVAPGGAHRAQPIPPPIRCRGWSTSMPLSPTTGRAGGIWPTTTTGRWCSR